MRDDNQGETPSFRAYDRGMEGQETESQEAAPGQQDVTDAQRDRRYTLIGLAAFAVIALVVAGGIVIWRSNQPDRGFSVNGAVSGTVGDPSAISKGRSCTYMDGTVRVGDSVVLRGSDGRILGKAALTAGNMEYAVCDLAFKFESIPSDSGYSVELDGWPEVVATERELRSSYFYLRPRSPYDVLLGKDNGQKIKGEGYNGE